MKRLLLALLAPLAVTSAFAEYPEKTVTIVVPFAAGGPTDKVGRDFAEAVRKPLGGQVVVIDNVAGAGGTLGTAKVAKAAPDGYTLLITHIGMATSPALYRNLQFKPLEDFEFLGLINEVPMTLISRPTLEAKNYAELAAWIQANKGKVNIANAGVGSASHLCGMLLQSTLKADLTPVPYKGTAPAMNDLLGGQVDIMCDQTTNTTGQIEGGKVKAFAVTTTKRLTIPALAKLPTLDGWPDGLQRDHLARAVRTEGHAQARARQDQRRAEACTERRHVHQERRSARRRGRCRCTRQPCRT
jgi:tripartite-type tricarboxylate transporter receptor subunit TctC